MPNREGYWIVPRDKPALLTHVMRLLAGDAQISFEGDLSRCTFPSDMRDGSESTTVLKRATLVPELDFTILELEAETVQPILDTILVENRYKDDIIHIQIARHGELQFGCYDQFHPECIACFSGVPVGFLDDLCERGIICSWERGTPPSDDAAAVG